MRKGEVASGGKKTRVEIQLLRARGDLLKEEVQNLKGGVSKKKGQRVSWVLESEKRKR